MDDKLKVRRNLGRRYFLDVSPLGVVTVRDKQAEKLAAADRLPLCSTHTEAEARALVRELCEEQADAEGRLFTIATFDGSMRDVVAAAIRCSDAYERLFPASYAAPVDLPTTVPHNPRKTERTN